MEYIDGMSLQEKIDKHGSLPLIEILRIGMQIGDGLSAAHDQGLVHRDIKPANILLENGVERVKITDFGLARTVDDASVTQSGTVAGTPMYMSPEQADGLQVDHRSDLFSLGTVLYALCTGHPPFRAPGTVAVLKRVVEDTPRPIREINCEVPEWLCDIISKLHAKKPEHRFQTAAEVAELLGRGLADVQAGRVMERRAEHREPVAVPAQRSRDAVQVLKVAGGIFFFAMLVVAVAAISFPLFARDGWEIRWVFLAGIVVLTGCTIVFWGLAAALKRTRLRVLAQPLHYAAVGCCVLVLGCALAWLRHALMPAPATLELTFLHPTARVVLESDKERREFVIEKVGHDKTIADLPAGAYQLTVFVADKAVQTEAIALAAGQRRARTIEPTGGLRIINESDEPVTIYGLVEPAAQLPPDEGSLSKITRETVGPRLALVDSKWAGVYRWVRGDHAGECFVVPGETAVLTIPKKSEPGWARLFNGKDLDGWKTHPDLPSDWKVENGILVGRGKSGYLFSDKAEYQNFHYRIEAKVSGSAGHHAGQLFRSDFAPRYEFAPYGNVPLGYEASICGELSPRTGVVERRLLSRQLNSNSVWQSSFVPADVWFTQEVIADGPRIEVIVNGKTVVTINETKETTKNMGASHAPPRDRGHLGLHVFGSDGKAELHIRKVEIKELEAARDEERLQGKWKAVATQRAGKPVANEARDEIQMTFTGDMVQWAMPGGHYQGTFKLDSGRFPKEIDCYVRGRAILGSGPAKIMGIYALVGETLTVCLPELRGPEPATGSRPSNFGPVEGVMLIHLERETKELPPKESGWASLFNGKDLDGWANPKKVPSAWKVENGVLIGAGDNAFLRSERGPYADFHLRMEAKYVGGMAGLVFREQSPDIAGAGYVCSMEDNKDGDFNTGAVSLMHTKNLMGTFAVPKQVLTHNDKWFKLEVIANGNRMQTFVDGKPAVNFVDIHHDFKEGFIALTVRGKQGELHVKEIKIKELPPEERGWIQLFNGTDLNGWDKPRYQAKWEVVDGVLTGSAKPHKNGMLAVLGKPLTNFQLRAQVRVSREGNAGVIFRSHRDTAYLDEFGGGKAGRHNQLVPFKSLVDEGQPVEPGQWFALELIADGKRVTTKINGRVVADFAEAAVTAGQIELEVDAGPSGSPATVAFRSIEVKELPNGRE
jgi:uncharacterized protein (TIGR03067 family)